MISVAPWAWSRTRHRPTVAVAVVVLTAGFAAPTTPLAWPPPGWVLIACDVGQGDGLVADNGGGHVVVIDTGPDPERMRACLDRIGATAVDLVVLTHYHADHVGGLRRGPRATGRRDPGLTRPRPARRGRPRRAARRSRTRTRRRAPRRAATDRRHDHGGRLVARPPHRCGVGAQQRLGGADDARARSDRAARRRHRARGRGPGAPRVASSTRNAGAASTCSRSRTTGRATGTTASSTTSTVVWHSSASVRATTTAIPAPATMKALRDRGFDVHRTDLEGDVAVVEDGEEIRVGFG